MTTKSVCYAKGAPKIAWKYIEFDETSHCPPFKKYQNMMINFHRRTRRHRRNANVVMPTATTQERVLSKYSTMSKQWTSSYSRTESPLVAESTTTTQEVTDWRWQYAYWIYCYWHWPNRFITGRGRGRNRPVLENSCKIIMGLVMCGNLSFIFKNITVNWEVQL